MSKPATALPFVASLCFASVAVQEFGPGFHRFTIAGDKEKS
jgi:hypothetical protein